ncbi:MAG: hypothetical protein WA364_06360 [Candidatus Nitrosopolaris sp.]
MNSSIKVITTVAVLAAFIGLFGTTTVAVPALGDPASSLQTSSHVTIQNTTTSAQDPLPGHQGHQAAIILPPRDDGKLWVGTVTWAASKPVELVILHGYNNVSADAAHGVPLIAKPPTGAVAITLIGPHQFMPSGNPVPSGTADFVGSAVAFHTLSGAKFTVTYSLDAVANTPMKITPKTLS